MNYRKIWEKHFGLIPLDEYGRKYDIHHIDGNRYNNDITNLVALSIKDHYDVHYKQGDWKACILIRKRLNLTKEEIEDINKKFSDSKIGTKCLDYVKEKISKTLTGRKHSKERIFSIMEGKKKGNCLGKGAFKDRGVKRDNGRTGTKHSEETKKRMSEAKKGKPCPWVSDKRKGAALPESTKEKLRSIVKTDDQKRKISEAKKGKPWTEARRLAQKQKNK